MWHAAWLRQLHRLGDCCFLQSTSGSGFRVGPLLSLSEPDGLGLMGFQKTAFTYQHLLGCKVLGPRSLQKVEQALLFAAAVGK